MRTFQRKYFVRSTRESRLAQLVGIFYTRERINSMAEHTLIETMIRIAREAGDAARIIQLSGRLGIVNKGGVQGTHFLTEGDLASEKIILAGLEEKFPGTPVVSEEKENDPSIEPNAFVVDPIDGTPCFIHGSDEWGVLITKLENHIPVAAIIYVPGRNMLAHAVRGQGACLNGQRVMLTPWPRDMHDKTMLGIEMGPWWAKANLPDMVLIPLLKQFAIRSVLSAAYGTIAMLRGETQAWVNLNVGWPWDFAPGWLFMKESGGWVSGADGQNLTFTRVEHMDVVYASDEEMARQILPLTTAWAKSKVL